MAKFSKIAGFLLLLVLLSCSKVHLTQIEQWSKHYIPDKRTAVFELEKEGKVLKGFVANKALKAEIDQYTQKHHLQNEVEILPDVHLGADTMALVTISVANVRAKAAHPSELSTQVLMGTPIKILKKFGGWSYIQTPDKYLGFIENAAYVVNQHWFDKPLYIYISNFGNLKANMLGGGFNVTDLVYGDVVQMLGQKNGLAEVALPDGRKGFIMINELMSISEFGQNAPQQSLEAFAQRMLGTPYLWGGTSTKGVDCSGFTRTAFMSKGLYLPRDASQQALVGVAIDTSGNFKHLINGDLLFFGNKNGRVSHVALYLGNMNFIHSSGMVQYGSFDPQSPNYDEFNLKRLLMVKRVLGQDNVPKLNNDTLYDLF